jgi:hypothetical protein
MKTYGGSGAAQHEVYMTSQLSYWIRGSVISTPNPDTKTKKVYQGVGDFMP